MVFAFLGDIGHRSLAFEINNLLLDLDNDYIHIDNKLGVEFLAVSWERTLYELYGHKSSSICHSRI
jgi:hypothetical protein